MPIADDEQPAGPDRPVVAVTGASGGIGESTARLLARRGHRVVLGARRTAELDRVVDDITRAGGSAASLEVDVTRPEDVQALVRLALDQHGRLDGLVSNAGVATTGPLSTGDLASWNQMIDVNLRGVLHGIAAALPAFLAQGSGHFVTVTSTSSLKWVPEQGVYAVTKAGVRALCEVLRQEVGPRIRSTIVCPGATATELVSDPGLRAAMSSIAMDPQAVAESIAFALEQPPSVDVGEIVVRSASQP